jgi:hypothetical protein
MNNNFHEYVKNKRIIIVGPSPSALKNTAKFIEDFDIVCRIKKSFPVSNENVNNIGQRTDILISHLKTGNPKKQYVQNNFSDYHHNIYNLNLKYILFPFPLYNQFNRFYTSFKESFPQITVPVICNKDITSLENTTNNLNNYCPTTGFAGIVSLLEYDIKELYITGITFQQDGFLDSYKSNAETLHCIKRTHTIHNMSSELNLFKQLLQDDKRITIDDTLKQLMMKDNL